MKQKRSSIKRTLLSVLLCLIFLAGAVGAYSVAGRFFPNAVFEFEKDMLFIGASVEMSEADTKDYVSVSLQTLMNDPRAKHENTLLVVSAKNPAHSDAELFPTCKEYKDTDILFATAAHDAYSSLSADIMERFGENIYITSSFRTRDEQSALFDELGPDVAQRPGESEHETGLALDVAVKGFGGSSFINAETGKYVNLSAWKHGFIIRYPEGKEYITGISYEPWHIRYVGYPHAEIIEKGRMTLEEYIDFLSVGKYFYASGYVIVRVRNDVKSLLVPSSFSECTISEDNTGYIVFTFKMSWRSCQKFN